jgi:hypothetical protein
VHAATFGGDVATSAEAAAGIAASLGFEVIMRAAGAVAV